MPGGGQGLWIVGRDEPDRGTLALTATSIKFPAWVIGPEQANPNTNKPPDLAVEADGALVLIQDGGTSKHTLRPANPSAPLTSFAVSPEGGRVAMAIGGRLLTAAIESQSDGGPTLVALREINVHPAIVDMVAWRDETELAVARRGTDGLAHIALIFTDGTSFDGIGPDLGRLKVTQLAAYPEVELNSKPINPILVQAGSRVFEIIGGKSPNLAWSDGSLTTPTDAPGASQTKPPHGLSDPYYPFFAQ